MSNINQKHNLLAERTLSLFAPPRENSVVKWDKKQPSQLKIEIKDNRPKMVVYTNIQGDDKNKGMIDAEHTIPSLNALLEAVIRAARGEIDLTNPIHLDGKGFFFGGYDSGKPKEKQVKSKTYLGRKPDTQELYISLRSPGNRPKINFIFNLGQDHGWMQEDQPLDPKVASELAAIGWARGVLNILNMVAKDQYQSWQEIKERKEANRRGGGGNNYGQGGGGNNYNQGGGQSSSGSNQSPDSGYDEDVSMW